MNAVVAAFNQEKALVGAFSVITNFRMQLFEALIPSPGYSDQGHLLLRQKEKGEVERDTLVWGGLSPAPAPAMGSMLHTAR